MKISSLFNLLNDSQDVLDFFDRVESPEQLVSRLDKLKRQGAEELMTCIIGLRSSAVAALSDTLEMNAVLDDEEDENLDLDEDILAGFDDAENPISDVQNPTEDTKKDAPTEK